MKTIQIIDAGTYYRVRQYIVSNECSAEEASRFEADAEHIDYEHNYYETLEQPHEETKE